MKTCIKNLFLLGTIVMGSIMIGMTSCSKEEEKKEEEKKEEPQTDVKVELISLTPTSKEIGVGEIFDITMNYVPKDATNAKFIWMSNNPEIASVVNGKVTGIKGGSAIITCKTEDGTVSAEANVTVKITAKDILKDGSETTIDFESKNPAGGKYTNSITSKYQNREFSVTKFYANGEDYTSQIGSIKNFQVKVKDNRYMELYMGELAIEIDTEDNRYSCMSIGKTSGKPESDIHSLLDMTKCIVNGTDIMTTLTYKTYIAQ